MAPRTASTALTQHACFACIGEDIVKAKSRSVSQYRAALAAMTDRQSRFSLSREGVGAVYRHSVCFAPETVIDCGDSAEWELVYKQVRSRNPSFSA